MNSPQPQRQSGDARDAHPPEHASPNHNVVRWTPELRARQSASASRTNVLKRPPDMIQDNGGIYYQAKRCGCGATVFPRASEALPVRCSRCRAERVAEVIAGRQAAD